MRLSPEEYKAGTMSEANLKLALRTLRDTGYVVVEDVFDRVFVDEFRLPMMPSSNGTSRRREASRASTRSPSARTTSACIFQ